MRYENSLTSNVEFYIDQILYSKFSARQADWSLRSSAQKFRSFLCDPSTINTPDFILRRYIQSKLHHLLSRFPDIADLTEDMNLAWEDNVIEYLSVSLERMSIAQGCKLEKKEWSSYLSGKHIPSKREKIFMLAFVLQMNVADTLDLLLACDLEPYSPRYPLDLICLFCQKDPGRYTWSQARQMLQDFLYRRKNNGRPVCAPTDGMTAQMSTQLEEIFQSYNESDGPDELVNYMVSHSGEFIGYHRIVIRKTKDSDSKYHPISREYFIPGYSLTRKNQYQQLMQYLVVFYPGYEQQTRRSTKIKGITNATRYIPVPVNDAEVPKLSTLVRAMLVSHRLLDLNWDDSTLHQDFSDDETAMDYEITMRKFWNNYMQHISAVERMLAVSEQLDSAENLNIHFFRRTDALVFLYFLVNGIRNTYLNGDRNRMDALSRLYNRGTPFDEMMEQLIDKIDYFTTELTDPEQYPEKIDMLRTCFDMLLSHMGYTNLYLPSVFDRLFFTVLLMDSPHELLPLVLCCGEW